jgi:hypothetical protein
VSLSDLLFIFEFAGFQAMFKFPQSILVRSELLTGGRTTYYTPPTARYRPLFRPNAFLIRRGSSSPSRRRSSKVDALVLGQMSDWYSRTSGVFKGFNSRMDQDDA